MDKMQKQLFFIERANEIHKNKYDYSKVEYLNANSKVCIICPTHGEFQMTPSCHLVGQGCPKCKGRGLSQEEVIAKANLIHNNKYDYSKVIFRKMHDKVTIICPIHGEFQQTLSKHISKKQGCPKCSITSRSKAQMVDSEVFFAKAKEIHGDRYDYSESVYSGMNKQFTYKCPIHGETSQRALDHLRGYGCFKCANLVSKKENEILDFVKSICCDAEQGNRSILNGKEIDIFIPSKMIGIEYNGLRWHSDAFISDKWYHINKTIECNNQGIRLLHIFEDEYVEKKDIVLNKILHILNLKQDCPKVMARKCTIREIDNVIAKDFLNRFHIQGYVASTKHLGAFLGDILVGVMSFRIENKSLLKWELTRFASDYNYICCGIGGKLFKWFIKNYKPQEIKSFADRRWTLDKNNNLYVKLGFTLEKELKPDYEYVLNANPQHRIHKFNFRKKVLSKKYGLSLTMTENEMVKELGYSKIWNCGLFKFVWKK